MTTESHSSNGLPRAERLRGRSAVSRLFAEGNSGFVYPIRYVWHEANEREALFSDGSSAVLFTVPKRFHKRANKRNLLRRRIKEAYRLQKSPLVGRGLNISLIYSTKEILEYDQISKAISKVIAQIGEAINHLQPEGEKTPQQ